VVLLNTAKGHKGLHRLTTRHMVKSSQACHTTQSTRHRIQNKAIKNVYTCRPFA